MEVRTLVNDGTGETEAIRCRAESSPTPQLPPETVRALFETHRAELLRFLIGVLRDVAAAQDVSQITFCRLLEVGHMSRAETIKGWLFTVALREALVYRRQNSLRDRHLKQYANDRSASLLTGYIDAGEDVLVSDEMVTRLRQSLSQLPIDQLNVVRQRIYEDKTFGAIASELNVPLGTVLTRMRLALEKVRKWIG